MKLGSIGNRLLLAAVARSETLGKTSRRLAVWPPVQHSETLSSHPSGSSSRLPQRTGNNVGDKIKLWQSKGGLGGDQRLPQDFGRGRSGKGGLVSERMKFWESDAAGDANSMRGFPEKLSSPPKFGWKKLPQVRQSPETNIIPPPTEFADESTPISPETTSDLISPPVEFSDESTPISQVSDEVEPEELDEQLAEKVDKALEEKPMAPPIQPKEVRRALAPHKLSAGSLLFKKKFLENEEVQDEVPVSNSNSNHNYSLPREPTSQHAGFAQVLNKKKAPPPVSPKRRKAVPNPDQILSTVQDLLSEESLPKDQEVENQSSVVERPQSGRAPTNTPNNQIDENASNTNLPQKLARSQSGFGQLLNKTLAAPPKLGLRKLPQYTYNAEQVEEAPQFNPGQLFGLREHDPREKQRFADVFRSRPKPPRTHTKSRRSNRPAQ